MIGMDELMTRTERNNRLSLVSIRKEQGRPVVVRPLRIEYPGALYHITARGNARAAIYRSDSDRSNFLNLLARVCGRYHWRCYAWCLMDNHYHLVVETLEATLSAGMRQLNSQYTQTFNRRHRRVGHVLQGRYKAFLVDREAYLLELVRYVVLNPVRAGLIRSAGQYRWSSYRAMIGETEAPEWLAREEVLDRFAKRKATARQRFIRFIRDGHNRPAIWNELRRQLYLGDERFVESHAKYLQPEQELTEIPRPQRRANGQTLQSYLKQCTSRDEAIVAACLYGHYKQKDVAEFFGLHYSSVSKILKKHENRKPS